MFNQPDKESVAAQYGRIIDALLTSSPRLPTTSKPPCGSADVHRVSQADLAPDLLEQSPGAAQ
ncbi:hypothetical protein HLY00_4278 [Mycolicibacterium hippocampi]|uniref:Uncharacterized protein n=1 Tax=Mycolicibacterium hippocampi TaxID=659824 RepID=A0A850PX34_9MYCO|nr:hypothetical protein [Mycolicibacterium hippocampi]